MLTSNFQRTLSWGHQCQPIEFRQTRVTLADADTADDALKPCILALQVLVSVAENLFVAFLMHAFGMLSLGLADKRSKEMVTA